MRPGQEGTDEVFEAKSPTTHRPSIRGMSTPRASDEECEPLTGSRHDGHQGDHFPGILPSRGRYFGNCVFLWSTVILLCGLIVSNTFWFVSWKQASRHSDEFYLQRSQNPGVQGEVQVRIETWPAGFLDDNMTVSDTYWRGLFPEGDGQVALPDSWAREMNLPASLKIPRNNDTHSIYIMAGFHQLHCLSHIRHILASYYFEPDFSITSEAVWGHTRHCLDALRQWILCHPDETLLSKQDGWLPGEGQLRKCKNFNAYKEWTEAHAYVFPYG